MGDMIVFGLKIAGAIALAVIFMTAIATFVGLLGDLVFGGVIQEVLSIISACLPFDAGAIFGALGTICNGILSFMVAAKIFNLNKDLVLIA